MLNLVVVEQDRWNVEVEEAEVRVTEVVDPAVRVTSINEGPEGPVGPVGPPGPPLNILGQVPDVVDLPATGNTFGDAWITTDDEHIHVWNGTAWIDIGALGFTLASPAEARQAINAVHLMTSSTTRDAMENATTFRSLTAASGANVPALCRAVWITRISSTADFCPMVYVEQASEPAHICKFQAADLRWFGITPAADGYVPVQAFGVKFDGSEDGTTGTDNTVAWQAAIDSGFSLSYADGIMRCLGRIRPIEKQKWKGVGTRFDRETQEFTAHGTAIVYDGVAREAFIESLRADENGGVPEAFTQTWWSNLSIWCTDDNEVKWLVKLWDARNINLDRVAMVHRATTLLAGNTSIGCLLVARNAGQTAPSWQFWFDWCDFRTELSREVEFPNTDIYEGYGYAYWIAGNDIHTDHCHFNNATTRGSQSGGIHAAECNWENTSRDATTEFDSKRALCILQNDVDHQGSIGAYFGACHMSQGHVAIIIDATAALTGPVDVGVDIAGSFLRRNVFADLRLIGNAAGRTAGGSMSATTCTTWGDNDYGGPGAGSGASETPRLDIVGVWHGFRISASGQVPATWLDDRDRVVDWHPRIGSTTIDSFGLAPALVGTTPASGNTLSTASYLGQIVPRRTQESASAANSAAEFHGDQFTAVRGSVAFRGGFYARFRFGFPLARASSRAFVGLSELLTAIPANVEPSTLLTHFGIACDSADLNWHVTRNQSNVAATREDLGDDYPKSEGVYEVILWAAPAGSLLWMRIERLDTQKARQRFYTASPTGSMPGGTARMAPHLFHGNGAGGLVVSLDLIAYEQRSAARLPFAGSI